MPTTGCSLLSLCLFEIIRGPDDRQADVGREDGVVGRLLECRAAWCKVETGEVTGWIRRSDVWGVYPEESIP